MTSEKTYTERGQKIVLHLRWPNASDRAAASEDASALVRDWITGEPNGDALASAVEEGSG